MPIDKALTANFISTVVNCMDVLAKEHFNHLISGRDVR
jgi:hypothetical protein